MAKLELSKQVILFIKKTVEHYNALRTSIQLSSTDLKVMSLTSIQPGEGKSTTSLNLAISFANVGYRTLLIDADMRNSVISGSLKATEQINGLSDYLSGRAELSEVVSNTDLQNLYVITSGPVSPNPTALLQGKKFDVTMDALRKQFDYIIVDTPPIGRVIDSMIIAQQSDGTALVTEIGAVNKLAVRRAKEQLEQAETPFLGVILNKVDMKSQSYGGYGGYGGYGNYGEYGRKAE